MPTTVSKDECNKADTSREGLAKLPAIRMEADPTATVSVSATGLQLLLCSHRLSSCYRCSALAPGRRATRWVPPKLGLGLRLRLG